uniref:Uncharacterized protein n=1 Tax=Anguilla anguilla TaxID=7936 RepID=A0A0E9S0F0_ANGAN
MTCDTCLLLLHCTKMAVLAYPPLARTSANLSAPCLSLSATVTELSA